MGTIRQSIVAFLKDREMTAREISQAVGVGEKEVYDHLAHIVRSKNLGGKFIVVPARCKKCGYVFKKRDRLTPPSRCFLCKGESVTAPRFFIRGDPPSTREVPLSGD